jgi:hypothetical protein
MKEPNIIDEWLEKKGNPKISKQVKKPSLFLRGFFVKNSLYLSNEVD